MHSPDTRGPRDWRAGSEVAATPFFGLDHPILRSDARRRPGDEARHMSTVHAVTAAAGGGSAAAIVLNADLAEDDVRNAVRDFNHGLLP